MRKSQNVAPAVTDRARSCLFPDGRRRRYAGTMGARFIDYMLTDRIAAPPEYRRYMREKQVRPRPPQPAVSAALSAAHSATAAANAHTSTVWRLELLVRAAMAEQSMLWGSQILFPHSFLVNNLAEVLPYPLGIPLKPKPKPKPRQRSKRNSRARGIAAGVSAALCRHRLRLGLADTRAARAAGGRVRVRMFQLAL
jgi:hypothetical protein